MSSRVKRALKAAESLRELDDACFLVFSVDLARSRRTPWIATEVGKAVDEFRAAVDALAGAEEEAGDV